MRSAADRRRWFRTSHSDKRLLDEEARAFPGPLSLGPPAATYGTAVTESPKSEAVSAGGRSRKVCRRSSPIGSGGASSTVTEWGEARNVTSALAAAEIAGLSP